MPPTYLKVIAIGLAALAFTSVFTVSHAGRVQLPGLTVPSSAAADRASVVRIFNESYSTYRYAQGTPTALFSGSS